MVLMPAPLLPRKTHRYATNSPATTATTPSSIPPSRWGCAARATAVGREALGPVGCWGRAAARTATGRRWERRSPTDLWVTTLRSTAARCTSRPITRTLTTPARSLLASISAGGSGRARGSGGWGRRGMGPLSAPPRHSTRPETIRISAALKHQH